MISGFTIGNEAMQQHIKYFKLAPLCIIRTSGSVCNFLQIVHYYRLKFTLPGSKKVLSCDIYFHLELHLFSNISY